MWAGRLELLPVIAFIGKEVPSIVREYYLKKSESKKKDRSETSHSANKLGILAFGEDFAPAPSSAMQLAETSTKSSRPLSHLKIDLHSAPELKGSALWAAILGECLAGISN